MIFKIISDNSTFPFTIKEPAKGMKLILRRRVSWSNRISNCSLNKIIHDKTMRYITSRAIVSFWGFLLFCDFIIGKFSISPFHNKSTYTVKIHGFLGSQSIFSLFPAISHHWKAPIEEYGYPIKYLPFWKSIPTV